MIMETITAVLVAMLVLTCGMGIGFVMGIGGRR
jgi:hypothetical protein